MSDVALKSISIIIGSFFILFGVLKVVPLFSMDLYRDMRGLFERSAKVFPLQRLTGWRPEADTMRRLYGAVEMVCGMVLIVGRENIADLANIVLMLFLFFALYANWALGEGLKEASHAIVLGLVLTCRFVIRLQTLKKDEAIEGNGDEDVVDIAFRKELRRRIAELHQSVCKTQELIKNNTTEEDLAKKRKKQGKSKKHSAPNSMLSSKKDD